MKGKYVVPAEKSWERVNFGVDQMGYGGVKRGSLSGGVK